MKSAASKKAAAISLFAVAIALLSAGMSLWFAGKDTEPTSAGNRQHAGNIAIQEAFQSFYTHASLQDSLCKGGFINDSIPELKGVSDLIVSNRILNDDPLQLAVNQDEAGIICLASSGKWVLFTALNPDSENNGKDYLCTDSGSALGSFGIDREAMSCKPRIK